jgi:hypothetical protein
METQRIQYRKRYAAEGETIEPAREARGGHGGADEHILEAFAEFIEGRRAADVAPREAAVSVVMGVAATRSSEERRVVEIEGIG